MLAVTGAKIAARIASPGCAPAPRSHEARGLLLTIWRRLRSYSLDNQLSPSPRPKTSFPEGTQET